MSRAEGAIEVCGFDGDPAGREVDRAVRAARRILRCERLGVSVCAVSTAESGRLNRAWRRHRGPADVLSFAAPGDEPGGELGEVYVCPPLVRRRSRRLGLPYRRWLAELVVHGMLHLMGFHHGDPAAADLMGAVQRALVARGPRA
ncbi:MAG: rRNA maturation RNase YbeY [Candidatus Coatesbacteria bacterium]